MCSGGVLTALSFLLSSQNVATVLVCRVSPTPQLVLMLLLLHKVRCWAARVGGADAMLFEGRGSKLECADRACLQPMHTPEPCAKGLGQCRTDGHRPHAGQVALCRSIALMGGLHVCQAALRYVGVPCVGPVLHNCTDAEPGHAVLGWHPAGSLW